MVVALSLLACGPNPEALLASGLALAPGDPAAAAGPLGEACAAGLIEACEAAGALPLGDDPRLRAWNERACEGERAAACARRSESPDDAFRERACGLGDGASCAARAATLAGSAREALLGRACEAGHAGSCLPAADAALAAGDPGRAAALYAVGCRADPDSAACLLAERASRGEPEEAPPWPEGDAAAVSEALWARCAEHDAWGCLQLAEQVERHGGPLPAASRGDAAWLRNQACDLQLVYACAPHAW
jgi:hypothetical protein